MKALIHNASNTLVAFVIDTDGYDVAEYTVLDVVGDPMSLVWDGAALVPRPQTEAEVTAAALDGDSRWQAMKAASPQQIETWLQNNVTDLASARAVLKILVLAIQKLARTR